MSTVPSPDRQRMLRRWACVLNLAALLGLVRYNPEAVATHGQALADIVSHTISQAGGPASRYFFKAGQSGPTVPKRGDLPRCEAASPSFANQVVLCACPASKMRVGRGGRSKGLPEGDKGRIGLAISNINPDVVYATVEAVRGESGFSLREWRRDLDQTVELYRDSPHVLPGDRRDLRVFDRVHALDTFLQVSEDGGKSFRPLGEKWKHVDNHGRSRFDPQDSDHLIAGCDGGLYESWDRGQTYRNPGGARITVLSGFVSFTAIFWVRLIESGPVGPPRRSGQPGRGSKQLIGRV